jgi:hypothetical protein
MSDAPEQGLNESHHATAAKSVSTGAKVAGGIGVGLLALLGGLAKHGGHAGRNALRHAGEAGSRVIRHADDFGRGASHLADDAGRSALRRPGTVGGASHLTNEFGHGTAGMGTGLGHDVRFGAGLENAPRFGEDVSRGYRPFGHDLEKTYVPFGGEGGVGPANSRRLTPPRSPATRPRPPATEQAPGTASANSIPTESSAPGSHIPVGRVLHGGQRALRANADDRDREDDQRAPFPAPRGQP